MPSSSHTSDSGGTSSAPSPRERRKPSSIWTVPVPGVALPAQHMCRAGKATPGTGTVQIEDGFLRSRGLGAELVPPLSLVCDELGIYYDPTRQSRLEQLIAQRTDLRPDQQHRSERLIRRITDLGLSKYNLGLQTPDLPEGHRILVPGQVEDDASIRLGAGQAICTNLALLEHVR